MTELKAIETIYSGFKFRSRLEARWAVFFDTLGIPYEYEPEGFELPSGWYLPDFWLPEQELWIEIKPYGHEDNQEMILCGQLASASGHDVYYCNTGIIHIIETPEPNDSWVSNVLGIEPKMIKGYSPSGVQDAIHYDEYASFDNMHVWCECSYCGALGIQYEGRAERNKHIDTCQHNILNYPGEGNRPPKDYNWYSPHLEAAYLKARQARFEHGENGE